MNILLETYEAGIALQGSEIKSIRAGQISLAEAYVQTDGKEAWLINAHIAPYEQANRFNHDPRRPRKLLLHKREIRELWNAVRQKGVTIVPVQVYLKDGKAKVEIAIAKGKSYMINVTRLPNAIRPEKLRGKEAVISKNILTPCKMVVTDAW